MINNTKILTKEQFIKMLSDVIKEDQIVLYTQNVNTIELKPKFNEKRVTFGLAADAFERDGVGDLMKLNGYLLGVVVCNKSILSQGAQDTILTKSPRKKIQK